jgi:hypothetical protein
VIILFICCLSAFCKIEENYEQREKRAKGEGRTDTKKKREKKELIPLLSLHCIVLVAFLLL